MCATTKNMSAIDAVVTHGWLGSDPALLIRVNIPLRASIPTTADKAAFRDTWIAAYDKYGQVGRFVLIVDISAVSLPMGLLVAPFVAQLLREMRSRSEKQVLVTGLIMSRASERIKTAVTMLYKPATHLVCAETLPVLRVRLSRWLAEQTGTPTQIQPRRLT
jgi:hypothetical protein